MDRKYKVLIIDNSPGLTGAYKSISAMTKAMEEDFDFVFCLPEKSSLLEQSTKARATVTLPFFEIRKNLRVVLYLPILFANCIRLLRFVRNNHVDIVHVNDLYNLVGVVVKMMHPQLKLVYHVRLLPSSYSGQLYRFWIFLIRRYADYTICVSRTVERNLGKDGGLHTVISDAIDVADNPSHRRVRSNDHVQLLYLANYTAGKGHDYAIKAFSLALKENSKLRLLMAGDDFGLTKNRMYKTHLRQLADQEGVTDKVVFEEFVDDTSLLFKSADIFLNFSKSESFSLTCLEALFHGVPVISTDSGGPSELMQSGFSGILVPLGDVLAMSKAILSLSNDERFRNSLADNGRQYVMANYNLSRSAKQLKEVYLNVISKSG